jgi:hypothetical protein
MSKIGLTLDDKGWRYARIRKFIDDQNLDGIFVASETSLDANCRYIMGEFGRIGFGFNYHLFPAAGEPISFQIPPGRPYVLRGFNTYKDDVWCGDARMVTIPAIVDAFKTLRIEKGRVGVTPETMPHSMYAQMVKAFPKAEFVDIEKEFNALRGLNPKAKSALRGMRPASATTLGHTCGISSSPACTTGRSSPNGNASCIRTTR